MKRSVLKPIATGIALALLIFFMPFILVGALMFMFVGFIFFRLFFARKMRKAFAGRMRYMNTEGLRSRSYTYDENNQVIYLSPKNYR
jgi:hypothetical protein